MKDFVLSTSTYTLHKSSCYHLSKVKKEHQKEFDSVEEAEQASDNRIKKCVNCFYEPKKGQ